MTEKPAPSSKKAEDTLKEITALAKRRGFVYPGSEIYGGLSNTFDYGPYGSEMMKNLRDSWWKAFIRDRDDVVGLDSGILLHPRVWEASGHVGAFNDPLIDCKNCKSRFRADHLLEEKFGDEAKGLDAAGLTALMSAKGPLNCPSCGTKDSLTPPRQFNLMFETKMGSVAGQDQSVYLRPETAQGIFINFKNIVDTCRVKVPFGVAQIGKSFRNEIVARQFVFRTREFEQMELEFFCAPGTQKEWFQHWVDYCQNWLASIGLSRTNIQLRHHDAKELSFYSEGTVDIEYNYPFGWGELWGIASRTDYDLKQHVEFSKKNLEYNDQERNQKYIPYVIEPSLGLNRLFLAILCDAYLVEDAGTENQRTVLRLHPSIAPVKAAIFPLVKKDGLAEIGEEIYKSLKKEYTIDYDISGAIGKRYYRQDELGTPFCFTVDYDTKENGSVTVRHRDSKKQERIQKSEIGKFLKENLG